MEIQFIKKDILAVTPRKAYPTDVGMDLTAISIYKKLDNGVILYDTGIAVSPPEGYYLEIVPRSSISKTGWVLANSIGIIDPSYTGNLYIALAPLSSKSVPLKLPFCRCQLVVRKIENLTMTEVDMFDETDRGSGGFGSTDANAKIKMS